MSRYTTCITTV